MSVILRGMQPQNGLSARSICFVPSFLRLRLIWCYNVLKSEGVERFVHEFLPTIRKNNSHVDYVLQRTHVNCDPFVVGEYRWGRNRKRRCDYKSVHQVLAMVEEFSVGGDFRSGRKLGVSTQVPRGFQIWDTETMGHDIYKIHSKWKDDPKEADQSLNVQDHPYYIHRCVHLCK